MNRPGIILMTEDFALRARLDAALEGVARLSATPPSGPNLLRTLVEAKPSLLLVDGRRPDALPEMIGLARRADPSLQALAVGDARDAEAVLAAMRAGAVDFLDLNEPPHALRAQILRHIGQEGVPHRAQRGGFELVLRAQPGGGEGLFAINLAALRARRSRDMLLIDCTLPASEAAAALDLKLSYTVQDAIKDLPRLDRTLASSAFARHEETGLMVLPLATHGAQDLEPIAPEALTRLVAALRPLFADTLLTAGGVRSSGLLREFMRSATQIYFVCQQKFTALSDGRQLLAAIDPGEEVLARTTLVVDEHHPGINLSEEQMRTTLGLGRSVRLPSARVELINGLNTGRPLVIDQPRSPYAQALMRLAGEDPGRTGPSRLIALSPWKGRGAGAKG